MHVKNSESQRKTNTKHLKHPINHLHIETPQDRQRGSRCAPAKGGRRWQGAVLRWQWCVTPHEEDLRTLYIEFCSKGKRFTRDKGPLTVSAGLGKWRGIHKGVKL